ncbi:ABC transporter permease [Burkholderia stagnalis]
MNGIVGIIFLDIERLWINRNRVLMSLVQPLLYLFVLGSGLGASAHFVNGGYQKYIYPGIVILTLLFNSSSAAIGIVVDRQVGFLKALLVAPVSRNAIAFGKILSGALQAMVIAILLLLLAPFVGVTFTVASLVKFVLAMALSAVVFSALGVGFAARLSAITSFPVFTNTILLPMFFLSGAIYPLDNVPAWLRALAYIDPVAYGVDLLRGSLSGHYVFPVPLSLAVLVGFLLAFAYSAVRVFDGRSGDN